ncbi:MAG: Asp-tRNA(Asn)/Glu-tRNA(Gln) amidotransferase subunit GatA [Ruminococcus sp.]
MALYKKSAVQLSEMLRKKECSSAEICMSILKRIKETECKIGAYITICDDIMAQAECIDRRRASGEELHLLAGIPIGLKDNISLKGVRNTCASRILENYIPPYDAYVTQKLKKAGMIITGKLNMDEFAMGFSTENSYFKKTANPINTDYVPGGSSGGCAAAVMSGETIMALGSDTGGSVRQPSAFCGAVGFKPTYGRVSRYGLTAFASSLDQIGTVCRDVSDTALLMSLISGYDKMDMTSANRAYPDLLSSLNADIRGLRIGVPCEYFGEEINDEVKESVHRAVKLFESKGAVIKNISLPSTKYAVNAYYIISSAEASSNLARYDGVRYGFRAEECESLADMYRKSRSMGFGYEVKRRIMLGTFVLSSGYYDEYYKKADNARRMTKQELLTAFEDCDVLVTPTYPAAAFRFGRNREDTLRLYSDDICTIPASLAGIPAVSIPCGVTKEGLPIGMQLMGRPFSEGMLLNTAYAYEKNTGGFGYISEKAMTGGLQNA